MKLDHETRVELEDGMIQELSGLVDSAILRIMNVPMTRSEALLLVGRVRSKALDLFPDKKSVFDLVILPRFRRVIDEYTKED